MQIYCDVIFLQICEKWESENNSVGQTPQQFSDRNSGHRPKFNFDLEHYE